MPELQPVAYALGLVIILVVAGIGSAIGVAIGARLGRAVGRRLWGEPEDWANPKSRHYIPGYADLPRVPPRYPE